MSLLFHRRTIGRAVAGDLSIAEETRLRAHLRRCAACRAYYDGLSATAAGLAASGGRVAEERARARLVAALGTQPAVGGARAPGMRAPRARRWWPAALLIAPAAAALLLVARPAPHAPTQARTDVTWRGGADDEAMAVPATLLVYASRRARGGDPGPLRLVADLPASGEGRVTLSDYVQFSVRGLRSAMFTTVVGIDDAGALHVYAPRPGTAPVATAPSDRPVTVGPSVDLQRGHRPGRLRLYALFSPVPVDEARLRAAATHVDPTRPGVPPLDLPLPQLSGVLLVSP
ncbi:MAG: anti-sigma factor family protein [Polyangia bacterium]